MYVLLDAYIILAIGDEGLHAGGCPFPPYTNEYDEVWINHELAFVDYCKSVCSYLKDEPNFLFEIWNEPSQGQADFFRVAHQCAEEIRQITTTPLVVQWGYCWDVDWAWDSGLNLPWTDISNMVYSGHVYRYHGTFANNEYISNNPIASYELREALESDEIEIILRDNKELVVKVPKEKDSHPFEI